MGNHTIRCEVAQVGNALETMTNTINNHKEIVVSVVPMKTVEPGTWPTKPKPGGKPTEGNQQAIPGGPPLPRGAAASRTTFSRSQREGTGPRTCQVSIISQPVS